MDIERERAEFERAVRQRFEYSEFSFSRSPDGYFNAVGNRSRADLREYAPVSMLWSIWQAARAERAEPRDDIRKYSDRLHNDTQDALVQQAARAERAEAAQRVPLTEAQVRRLYDNSPESHREVTSFAAFARLWRLFEVVGGLPAEPNVEQS